MKSLCGVDDAEPADDTTLLETGDDYEEMGMLISEIKSLVESAQELAE